mgnify:FL=1
MKILRIVTLLALAALVSCGETGSQKVPGADIVITNAKIWTGDPEKPWVEAMAIQDEYIVQTGTNAEVSHLVEAAAEVIDAPEGIVVPGFIDSHVHFLDGGFALSSVKLRDALTKAEFEKAKNKLLT